MHSLFNDNKVIITLIGAVAILVLTAFVVSTYLNKMKHSKADGKLDEEEWDGIKKFKNDLPIGWALSFICVIIWGFWYFFFGYPLNAYSQIGEYNEEVDLYNKNFEKKWATLGEKQLVAMGDSIFQVQCTQCHGIDKRGIDGKAADLSKWGRSEHIVDVILNGSKGLGYMAGEMTPIPVTREEAMDIANFVMAKISEVKAYASEDSIARGDALFATNCVACHGVDGKGVEGVENFAPDLSTYGTYVFLQDVLKRGKDGAIGKMPSFEYAKFNAIQQKALNSFIVSND